MTAQFAAIDVGTNSVNLLITDAEGNEILREVNVERLGEGLQASGQLSKDAMARSLDRISAYKKTIDSMGVSLFRVVITAPGRLASNAEDFLDQVRLLVGNNVLIASGDQEALYSHRGTTRGRCATDCCLIDIGGGSTEFARQVNEELVTFSIPLGAVTLTSKHFTTDPPRPEDLTNAIGEVTDHLDDLIRLRPELAGSDEFAGVAGTIVTVAAVEIGLMQFDSSRLQDFVLTREAVEDVFRTLATETLSERKLNPGLPSARADVIVGGCCILVAIMRRLNLPAITISVRSLLDGVIDELRSEQ